MEEQDQKRTEIATVILPSGAALLRREVGSQDVERLGQVTLEDIVASPDRMIQWFQVVQLHDIGTALRRVADVMESVQGQVAKAQERASDPAGTMRQAMENLDSLIPGISEMLRQNLARMERKA